MKHILNNLTEEEKNSIREQHTGGMKVMTENFSKLLNSKLGDAKPLVKEKTINEGLGTGLLVLTGIGVLYLGRKIKKFVDKYAKFLPSAGLSLFLSKIKSIEEGKQGGEILVREKGPYTYLLIKIDGEIFDSMTIDMENDEIYSGHKVNPRPQDRIIPMTLPKDSDDQFRKEVEASEELLVNELIQIIARYSEEK